MRKKLSLLMVALIAVAAFAWAEAAIENSGNQGASDSAINGTSYTLDGTYIAGKGGVQQGDMPDKGVKMRSNKGHVEFKVNAGYKITGFEFWGCGNTTTALVIKSVTVDGGDNLLSADVTLPGKADGGGSGHFVLSDIGAEDNITITFAEGTSAQFVGTWKVTYEQTAVITQEITSVTLNGAALSETDLETLKSTKALTIDGSNLNGVGILDVTLSSGGTTVSKTFEGTSAVYTFTINATDQYTVTVNNVVKTYSLQGIAVGYKKGETEAEGANTNTITMDGISFAMVNDAKAFQYGSGKVTLGENDYVPLKLSTGSAVNVTFPEGKKATKVIVYGWSANGNGKIAEMKESAESEKSVDVANDIYYATNTASDIYPSVYEYELDNWESLYFNPGGSTSQPFVVMDFVFADETTGGDEPTIGSHWEKATSIAVGDVLLLTSEGTAGTTTWSKELKEFSSNIGQVEDYTNTPAGLQPLTVEEGNQSGTYAFKNADGKYLAANSSNQLPVIDELNDNSSWTVTWEDDIPKIANVAITNRVLQYNSGSPRFACYTSAQKAVTLWKKVGSDPVETRIATTITLGEYATTAEVGAEYALPTATVTGVDGAPVENATVTWSSSDTEVAEIAATYAGLNLKKAGKATITATYEGDNNYKGSTASFELTVTVAPYTTIDAMVADATSTKTSATYQFEDLLVTYVNGQNTYVSDDTDGFLFFGSELGLEAGSKYTGTATGQLYTYNGLPEMSLGANGINAQVSSEGNLVAWPAIAPAELQNNINLPVTIENAIFVEAGSGKNLTFKVGDTEFAVYNNWSINVTALEAGKTYTLKGIGSIYVKGETTTYQLYLVSFEEKAAEEGWRDIKVDLTNKNLLTEGEIAGINDETNKTPSMNIGIVVDAEGNISRVANDADNANAVLTGKWHSNDHGWSNFSATVPVEGPVKITFGTCAWGGNVTVKDATGAEVVKAFSTNTGACYHNNKDANIVSAYYKGDAATLTIAGGSYVPYFAVEAVDPADIPSETTVTFDAANAGAQGVAPAAQKVEIGSKVKIPANTSLYIEGKTLTAWTDGTTEYKAGDEVTVNEDMTLTPVFTANTVSFANRTAEVTALWDFQQKNGAVAQGIEGNTGIVVTQITIGNEAIDFPLDIDATSGKYNNKSWQDWAQINGGTLLKLPAYKGTVYSSFSMNDNSNTTFNGEAGTYDSNVNTYTYEGSSEEMTINIQGGSYYRWLKAVYPAPTQEEGGFADIKVDLTNKNLLTEGEIAGINDETNKTPSMNIGIVVDAEGNISRVANDADNANAVLTGKWHSNDHGWSNFSATVPVEGTVKITFGTCAWGGDVTVKNAEGATVATFNTNTGACYHNNKESNVVSAYYKQDVATTLTISGGSYVPYFAVEKVDPKDIPSDVKFVFDASESGAVGVAPEDATVGIGKTFTMPKNFTLYKEGYTLTAWTDGTNSYAVGENMTAPDAETVTLTPVFTQNEVSLAERTDAVTLKWNFRRDQGAPAVGWEGQDGLIWVAQATIAGKTIDVALPFSTNPGKFANGNWTDWCQLNEGTTFHVPSCKGATISIEAFSEMGAEGKTATTIDGQTDYTSGKTISYEIGGSAEAVDVVIGNDGSYYRYIQAVLPVVQSAGGETFDNAEATIIWPMDEPANYSKCNVDPASAFATTAVDLGAVRLMDQNGNENATGTSNVSSGVTFSQMRPTNDASDYVTWCIKPATGLTFTPKKISAYIVRFGTDAENGVTISAKAGDGDAVTLGNFTAPRNNKSQADDKFGQSANYAVNGLVEIELTEAQQATLASGETLYIMGTIGVGNAKAGGIAQVTVSGVVNGTKEAVDMYTLSAVADPEEAGTVSKYPNADEYEAGTEVTLTATENFGYDFVNWTNAAGEEVSTDAKFKYTVNSNETLTANFQAVETYELALTVDGTNDYMVTVDPAPEVVDGKWMYEAGTAVQLTANQYKDLVTFTNWSDGETNSSKLISMTEDVTLTAFYAQADIIAGWDFYKAGNNGRKADFYAEDNDADALNLVNTETGDVSGWLDKSTIGGGGYESFAGAAVNWRTGASNGDVGHYHWQTKVNAEAFESINVQFQMLYNYNAYQRYNAEYSLDGESWTNFGSITMEGAKNAASFSEKLPEACNNQKDLYIRMIADKTSNVDGSASANDGNTLAMFFITGTPKIVDDGKAPVLVSTVPADNATGVSASGKIVLTFDERVKVVEGTVAYLNNSNIKSVTQNPMSPTVSGKVVTFEYKGLDYGTKYNFVLAGKTIGDLTDNMIQDAIEISFTTMERPTVDKKLYDAVVENVNQLLAAISAAQSRSDKNVRYRIFIKNGEYTIPVDNAKMVAKAEGYEVPECITFINTSNLSIIGESRDGVIITNGIDKNATFAGTYGTTSKYDGIGNSDVFQLSGSDYYFQDLTIETGMDDGTGRDLAIQDKATRTIYKNTGLRGYQDTWTSNNDNGLYYFEDGYLRGRTDYMCGKGDAFFNGVELRQIYGGYAAVPSKSIKYGFTYKGCTINGEESPAVSGKKAADVDGNYTLGRPWGSGTPVALFIDTKMNVVPSAIGWNEMSGGWPKRFAEYNSTTSTGSVIDLSGRKTTFGDGHANNPVLTAEEALEAGNLHNMFGEWDPTLATEQAPIVSDVKLTGGELTWTGSNYALLYAIVKNGEVIDFTTETTYNIGTAAGSRRAESTDKYQIRAANEMGGLNEASEVATATDGIENVNVNENVNINNGEIYNLQGIRVNKAQKGVYIINGKKVVIK